MIPDDKLIGWLCFLRHQWSNGVTCMVPNEISAEFISRGWVDNEPGQEDDGCYTSTLTELGTFLSDVNAAEWGINSIPEESEA